MNALFFSHILLFFCLSCNVFDCLLLNRNKFIGFALSNFKADRCPQRSTMRTINRCSKQNLNSDYRSEKLSVTVLSGFLGAGKTTLLNNILKSQHNHRKYAVIVNDMSELNIDEKMVQPFVQHQEEKLVELSNGCICCTLREDLLKEVSILAKSGKFDHLLIESTGISEPFAVAETFTFQTENGTESLMDIAEIVNMVTVVDAFNFVRNMQEAEDLKNLGLQATEEDSRTITDLIVSQVEFASIIILNKCDLVSEEKLVELRRFIRSLNADARLLETTRCQVDVEKDLMSVRSFDLEKVSQSPTWLQAINSEDEKIPESEEYGISSFVFRARRPFHPTRLMDFVETDMDVHSEEEGSSFNASAPVVIRSKGFFWLATRMSQALVWSQAGGLFQITPGGMWWIDTPKDAWPSAEAEGEEGVTSKQIEKDWQEPFGDRRQEIVFIGTNLDKADFTRKLEACLLTDEEMSMDVDDIANLDDPFPQVAVYEDDGEGDGEEQDEGESEEAEPFTLIGLPYEENQ